MNVLQENFLTADQKAVKHLIMIELFQVLQKNMNENVAILDSQSSTDIVFSCLIMFGREILVDMIMSTSEPDKYIEPVLKSFAETMASAVAKGIEGMMCNTTGEVH